MWTAHPLPPGMVHFFFIHSVVHPIMCSLNSSCKHRTYLFTLYIFVEHLLGECDIVLDAGETAVPKVDSNSYCLSAYVLRR